MITLKLTQESLASIRRNHSDAKVLQVLHRLSEHRLAQIREVREQRQILLAGVSTADITAIWETLYNGVRHESAAKAGHAMPELSRRGLSVAAISAPTPGTTTAAS